MRATALLPLVVLVAAISPAPAPAQADAAAQTVTVKVGRLATVPVTVDADEVDYVVLGEAVDGFREYDAAKQKLRIRVIGYEPGTGYIVVSGQKAGKLLPLLTITVKVIAVGPVPPPVPPVPPVPPPDPGPYDPLGLGPALKAAAVKDGWPVAKFADLAGRFQAAAGLVNNRDTVGDILSVVAGATRPPRPDGTPDPLALPPSVRAVLAAPLKTLDAVLPPTAPDRVVTDADKSKIRTLLAGLAGGCMGAQK